MNEAIERFFASQAYAVVGVSADRRKFGNAVFRMMKEREFQVYPVHPTLQTVEGSRCFASVADLPDTVKSIVTVVPPAVTEEVIRQSAAKGIAGVWMQPGSESREAVDIARKHAMTVVQHECVLMFLEPVTSIHALHRWIKKLVGRYPK